MRCDPLATDSERTTEIFAECVGLFSERLAVGLLEEGDLVFGCLDRLLVTDELVSLLGHRSFARPGFLFGFCHRLLGDLEVQKNWSLKATLWLTQWVNWGHPIGWARYHQIVWLAKMATFSDNAQNRASDGSPIDTHRQPNNFAGLSQIGSFLTIVYLVRQFLSHLRSGCFAPMPRTLFSFWKQWVG
jgi:hypothetical protein